MTETNNTGALLEPGSTIDVVAKTDDGRCKTTLRDAAASALLLVERRASGKEKPIATPWSSVNRCLPGGGYWPGMHVLVGGTGAGKSAWALEVALHAAKNGAAVCYVGLELDSDQVALRLMANQNENVSWSHAYTGKEGIDQQAFADAAAELSKLKAPFIIESGPPGGWPIDNLAHIAQEIRKEYKDGPALVVIDFLQIVGTSDGTRELREKIGKAAYLARQVSREHGITVLLISSVARTKYNSADILLSADLQPESSDPASIGNPDSLVGLGKESGEIEYAADSVCALLRATAYDNEKNSPFVLAFAKVRAGKPHWAELRFNGARFTEPTKTDGRALVDNLKANPASDTNTSKKTSTDTRDHKAGL